MIALTNPKLWAALLFLTLLSGGAAVAETPRIIQDGHDVSGQLVWIYTGDWQIVQVYRGKARPDWPGKHVYKVYLGFQLMGAAGTLEEAQKVIADDAAK